MGFKFLLLLIWFAILLRGWSDPDFSNLKLDGQKEIHVFFGVASNSTLLQMLEFIKLDKRIPKIVAWHLHPNALKLVAKQYNAVTIDLYPKHGQTVDNVLRNSIRQNIYCLGTFLSKCKGLKIVLHMNWRHVSGDWISLMYRIGANKIKVVHLYEDGMGSVVYNSKNEVIKDLRTVKRLLRNAVGTFSSDAIKTSSTKIWPLLHLLHKKANYSYHTCLHKIITVTYHLGFLDAFKKSNEFSHFNDVLEGAVFEDVDYRKKAEKLSNSEKQLLAKMLGIDLKKLKNLDRKSKKKALFIMGVINWGGKRGYSEKFQLSWLKICREKLLPDSKNSKYTWFFKEHPSILSKGSISKKAKKMYPDLIELNRDFPFEVLILFGFEPDKVCGMWSSITFSLKKDQPVVFVYTKANTPSAFEEINSNKTLISCEEAIEKYGI